MCLTPLFPWTWRQGPTATATLVLPGSCPASAGSSMLGAASFPGEIASAQMSEMRYDPCVFSTGEVPVVSLGMAVLLWKASVWYFRVERWRIHSHYQHVLCKHSRAHTKTVSLQYLQSLCFHSYCNKFGSPKKPSLASY